MRGQRASTLLRAPVFVRGIRLGEAEDVLLDPHELQFYRSRGRTLASTPELAETVIGPDGAPVVALTARC